LLFCRDRIFAEKLDEKTRKLSSIERALGNETFILIAKHRAGELHREIGNLKEELRLRDRQIETLTSGGVGSSSEEGRARHRTQNLEARLEKLQTHHDQIASTSFDLLQALANNDQREAKKAAEHLWTLVGDEHDAGLLTFSLASLSTLDVSQKENMSMLRQEVSPFLSLFLSFFFLASPCSFALFWFNSTRNFANRTRP